MEDLRCTICWKEEGKPLKIDGKDSGERICPTHVEKLKEWLKGEKQDPWAGKRKRWAINGENLGLLSSYQENGLCCLIYDLKKEHGTEMDEYVAEIEDKFYENLTKRKTR